LTHAQIGAHHPWMKLLAAAVFVLLAVAAGCGGENSAKPVAASSCAKLLYEGNGEPDVIIVSDFPRRGIAAEFTTLDVEAIKFVLKRRDYRAGDLRIGYQSCNDTVGDKPYDSGVCERNAKAYAAAKDVIGVIGPWNSGCAALQIPIVSRKAAGPLAMISPSNTDVALTRTVSGGSFSGDELYPDGVHSYLRLVTHDFAQGIAAAHLAKRQGARRAVPDIGKELGAAGQGLLVTNPGFPPEELPVAGQRFLRELAPWSTNPLYAAESAQATEVLLDAIARSDGTRASVVDELFRTKVTNGILGSFSFDRYGDIAPAPVGIFRVEGGNLVPEDVIRAPLEEFRG
jgi:ABC-type branched-subunit amino acid transport system substrate-binding protein